MGVIRGDCCTGVSSARLTPGASRESKWFLVLALALGFWLHEVPVRLVALDSFCEHGLRSSADMLVF